MVRSLIPISALLLSDALLLLGHGLLLTLLPVAANQLGFSAIEVALTGSAYFLGIIGGCLATPHVLHAAYRSDRTRHGRRRDFTIRQK